jgi:hypothetical protein
VSDVYEEIKAEPKRDRYGRYLISPPDGGKAKSYTRATTIAETLDDRFNLEAWKVRTTALGIVQRPDLYAAIASTPIDDKQALNRLCDQAREAAAGSAGANLGTALHRFTERINRGEDVVVPAPWDADVAAYKATLAESGWSIVAKNHIERIVVLEQYGIAGMFDMILSTFRTDVPSIRRIADLKTGATLDFSWGAIAVQLAIYAHADTMYNPATERHEPMPTVDQNIATVIHLPAGKATCTLYEVNIAAGWEAAQQALWVRQWRKDARKLATPVEAVAVFVEPKVPTISEYVRANPLEQPAPDIDEGDNADPVAVDTLRARYEASDHRLWIDSVTEQAAFAGHTISIRKLPSQRRYLLGLALIRFAELGAATDPDMLRIATHIVTGDPDTGIGTFTLGQADTLCQLAVTLHRGGSIVYGDDGNPTIKAA